MSANTKYMVRGVRLTLLSLTWWGCGGAPKTPETPRDQEQEQYAEEESPDLEVPYDFDAPPEPTTGTATQDDKWWESGDACPEGSQMYGGPPPEHDQVGCKTDKGKNVGRATKFHPSGKKREEGTFENHFAHGLFTEWDEAGDKISETPYVKGQKNGLETIWYPGGVIKSQRPYVDGRRHGIVFIWDQSERKRTAVPYERGKQHGPEARWDVDGKLARVIRWDHGKEM